jgi:hypothetical protein
MTRYPHQYSRTLAVLSVAFLLACTGARSQGHPVLQPGIAPPPTAVWPAAAVYQGETLVVITVADPLKRRPCKVDSIDADALVCASRHGHPVSFRKEDIAALTVVRTDRSAGGFLGGVVVATIGAAIFYGAIVVASVATPLIAVAIPIALVGSVAGVGGLVAAIYCIVADKTESLLYQKPGEALQLSLKS